jgi:hypothetical protein
MFYDSIKVPGSSASPPIINAPLLDGWDTVNSSPRYTIIGAGVIGDYQFSNTKQFCGSYVSEQSLSARFFQARSAFITALCTLFPG